MATNRHARSHGLADDKAISDRRSITCWARQETGPVAGEELQSKKSTRRQSPEFFPARGFSETLQVIKTTAILTAIGSQE